MGFGRTTSHDRVIGTIAANAASMLRIAQAHSLCADDAQDACQRALEIYLERLDEVDEATEGAWLRTVCKHEAMRIRDQRRRFLPPEDVPWDLHLPADDREAEERAVSLERVARAAEALQGCKPDEATAMLLKADGSSYAEIGELTGWSYTKVDRCLKEGRRRFLDRFSAIDSGAACEASAPVLAAIVGGAADAADLERVRPHLRHCAACRATLRGLYETQPALGALLPAGLLVAAPGRAVARAYEAVVTALGDRVARAHALLEALTSSKAAAVVASAAAVAVGGAAVAEGVAERPPAARSAKVQRASAHGRAPAAPRPVPTAGAPRPARPKATATAGPRRRASGRRRGVRTPRATATAPPRRESFRPVPAPAVAEAATPEFSIEASQPVASATPRTTGVRQPADTEGEFGFEQ